MRERKKSQTITKKCPENEKINFYDDDEGD